VKLPFFGYFLSDVDTGAGPRDPESTPCLESG
jgi:hypothetical protein